MNNEILLVEHSNEEMSRDNWLYVVLNIMPVTKRKQLQMIKETITDIHYISKSTRIYVSLHWCSSQIIG